MDSRSSSVLFVKQLPFTRQACRDLTNTQFSHYFIYQPFKYGPNSTVYSGIDKTNSRKLAFKVVDFDKISDNKFPEGKQQFRTILKSQAYLMNRFNSPHLLKCYEVFESDFMLVLVLDYCFISLADVIDKIEFKKKEAFSIIKRSFRGLNILHEKGVLHLNLKPENIMIKNGEPVLADFGFEMLSLQKRSSNSSPSALELYVKTTSFSLTMSPEILKHNNFSKSADYWSLKSIISRLGFPFYLIEDSSYPSYFYLLDEVIQNQRAIDNFKNSGKQITEVETYLKLQEQQGNNDIARINHHQGVFFKYKVLFLQELALTVFKCSPQIYLKYRSMEDLIDFSRGENMNYSVRCELLIQLLKVQHCLNIILKIEQMQTDQDRQVCHFQLLLMKFCRSVIDQGNRIDVYENEENHILFSILKKAVLKMEESLKDKKKRIDNNLSTTLGLIGGRFISLFTDNSIKNKRDMFLAEEDKNFSKYHQFIDFLPQYYNVLVKSYFMRIPGTGRLQKELQNLAKVLKLRLFDLHNTSFRIKVDRLLSL